MKTAQAFRTKLRTQMTETLRSPEAIQSLLGDLALPEAIALWLARLALLEGAPFNYLVPHEDMLPLESIRFFRIDKNWIDALIEGACSLGRGLARDGASATAGVDHALRRAAVALRPRAIAAARARQVGPAPREPAMEIVSGFLLRSTLVADYPGLGVQAWPRQERDGGQQDQDPLALLRLDRLGPHSNTLICLVDGDAGRFDLHEPPEHLHYGIDSYAYDVKTNGVSATKALHLFNLDGGRVVFTGKTPIVEIGECFRSSSPRVLKTSALAQLIAGRNGGSIGSAEMGFEMTEGVGQVSFAKTGERR